MQMRKIIALIENASATALSDAIRAKVSAWIEDGQSVSAYEINNGQCEEFADEIVEELGGQTADLFSIDAYNLCAGNADMDSHWDVPLIQKLFPKSQPPAGLTYEDIWGDIPNHAWIVHHGRHYDAECPNGVDNFFDLPLIAKMMKRVAAKKRRKTRRKGLGENAAPAFFIRATPDPRSDLQRGFSCVSNAFVKHHAEIAGAIEDTYPDGADHLLPPRQDPLTGGWCWEPESGLSSFAVRDEHEFGESMERIRTYASHYGCVAIFASSDYDIGSGTDGEDLFRDGRFLGWLDLGSSYADFQAAVR